MNKIKQCDQLCDHCKCQNTMKYCYKEGSLVCTSCGYVSVQSFIDETAEYRIFNDDQNNTDPTRAGTAVNQSLEDGGLGTVASGQFQAFLINQQNARDKTISMGIQKIKDWGYGLKLQQSIIDKSIEIFEKIKNSRSLKGRSIDQILATTLFVASRIEKKPLSVPEIEVQTNVTKAAIKKCFNLIKHLVPEMIYTRPSVFVKEVFSGKLNLTPQCKNLGVEIADKIQQLGIIEGRNPKTIAACSIYMATKILQIQNITLRDVSRISEIADNTVKNAYKDIYNHLYMIIPQQYQETAKEFLPQING